MQTQQLSMGQASKARALPTAHSPLPTAHSLTVHWRSAFTLVELLVVIAIIGVLASLLIVAGRAAWVTAQKAAIRAEVVQLNDAFTEYGNRYGGGGTFPPNVIIPSSASAQDKAAVFSEFERHFKKTFPRSKEPQGLLQAIAGVSTSSINLQGGLSPYESLHFWLRGFSKDPEYPISGPGGPSFIANQGEDLAAGDPIFAFEELRLGPRNSDNTFAGRFLEYPVTVNGTVQNRRINFWQYIPRNRKEPYAYFDCSRELGDRLHVQSGNLVAIKSLTSAKSTAQQSKVRDIRYANDGKCQILCCGLDDRWGDFSGYFVPPSANRDDDVNIVLYPDGPFTGEVGDTITNFTNNTTLADDQP